MTSRRESRKRAYYYIMEQSNKLGKLPINSVEKVDVTFYISLHEPWSLKEGLSDPSPKLAATLKKLFGSRVSEAEVDAYLVTPFSTRS